MEYFYIVDSLKQMREEAASFTKSWEAIGTQTADVAEDRHGVSEVLVRVKFRDHGDMDAFEALSFVHPLPDPLDNTELSDEHMGKLQRFHGYTQDPTDKKWKKQTAADPVHGKPAFVDVLTAKPHTRKVLNDHVSKMFPSFRFRIFH